MFITPLSLIYPENGEQRTENRRERKTDVLKKGNEGRLKTKKTSKEGGGASSTVHSAFCDKIYIRYLQLTLQLPFTK